jgi:hypothetical protein
VLEPRVPFRQRRGEVSIPIVSALRSNEVAHTHAELFERKRLAQIVARALAKQVDPHLFVHLRGEEHDGHSIELTSGAHLAHEIASGHIGHHEVGQDQIGHEGSGLLQPFSAVPRDLHAIVGRQAPGQEPPHVRVVFDDQHRRQSCRRGRHRLQPVVVGDVVGLGEHAAERSLAQIAAFGRVERDLDGEQGALLRRSPDGDAAAVEEDDVARDREPEAGASEPARAAAVELPEALEHELAMFGRDARPAVGHFDLQRRRPFALRHRTPHASALGSELERVREEVRDDSLQHMRVELGLDHSVCTHHVSDVAVARVRLEVTGPQADHRGRVEPRVRELHLTGLELRRVEQIVHVAEEQTRVADRGVQIRLVRGGRLLPQSLERTEDERERRAELVADVREEPAPQLVERARLCIEAFELGLRFLELA